MAFTYFFRDMQTLEMIRDHALPNLMGRRFVKIWDAGCAMGPEPYSLAIVIREKVSHMYFRNIKITASDIDGSNLFGPIIKNGLYPRDQVDRLPQEVLEKYFDPNADRSEYRIIDEIRNAVGFEKHDLLSLKPVGQNFSLIVCKNVLLHFTAEQRVNVVRMFYESLADPGYLAMEQTQKLPDELEDLFEPVVSNARLYRKKAATESMTA